MSMKNIEILKHLFVNIVTKNFILMIKMQNFVRENAQIYIKQHL